MLTEQSACDFASGVVNGLPWGRGVTVKRPAGG